MIAYHGDTDLKARFVALIREHEAQDRIIQGAYWKGNGDGRGCAVGCSINSLRIISGRSDLRRDDHGVYEELIGVPRILARLEDGIFEGLPLDEATRWPARFAAAIRPGADLSTVWPRFAVWLLTDAEHGVITFAKTDKQRSAIQAVSDLYSRQVEGEEVTEKDWRAAYAYAADAAADAAAYAYAADAAAYAADAADAYAYAYAYAAAAAAADAAAAAADAYADAAAYAAAYARQQARIVQADRLIALLEAA